MVATVTASYFLLTADYGSEPNALDPVSLHIFMYFRIVLFSGDFYEELGFQKGDFASYLKFLIWVFRDFWCNFEI